jgi:NADP-dependent 3-hydroxy acid dehydrogenase YdfG
MTDQRDLTDTVVAVTGATAGIGRATARLLVKHGARVALLGRRQSRLDELVAELGEDRVVVVAGDVADPEVNARLVEAPPSSRSARAATRATPGWRTC